MMKDIYLNLKCNIASVIESILQKILVSSAKHATFELVTASGKSLTYKRKSIGSKILPCGTPEHTGFGEEVAPRVVTRCWRSCRYEMNHWRRDPPMLYLRSLFIRAVWLTLSKAFVMSMKTQKNRNSENGKHFYSHSIFGVSIVLCLIKILYGNRNLCP